MLVNWRLLLQETYTLQVPGKKESRRICGHKSMLFWCLWHSRTRFLWHVQAIQYCLFSEISWTEMVWTCSTNEEIISAYRIIVASPMWKAAILKTEATAENGFNLKGRRCWGGRAMEMGQHHAFWRDSVFHILWLCVLMRGCIRKFPNRPPGARTSSGTALCY